MTIYLHMAPPPGRQSMGRNSNKGGEESKKGRAEVIQIWVEYFLTLALLVWVCL